MFDDLAELDSIDTSAYSKEEPASNQQRSYGGNNNRGNYNGGGHGNNNYGQNRSNGNGGGNFFKHKEDVLEEPYIPITIYVDRDFPPEIKTALYNIASKLINKNITVRYNGDDIEFHERIAGLSSKYTEVFIPWRNFNSIDSKHYFNGLTCNHLAQKNFSGWDKIPDSVKAMLARNVRMVFGDKNNSITLCVITWSKDGASKVVEVNKDTGRAAFIIKTASSYGFPVINIGKPNSENILEKIFHL